MRRLTSALLAVALAVATVAIAWASASAVGPSAGGAVAAHGHAAAAPGGAPAAFAVHHGHPDGADVEDCAAMALGCAGLVAHAAPEVASAGGIERAGRAAPCDVTACGTSPGLIERPPRA